MIRVKLTSILVNDQDRARRFYTDMLGFQIKHDIPMGGASWLTLVAPDDAGGVELLLEPTGHPASVTYQQVLYNDGIPLAQLYTEDLAAEYARLKAKCVIFSRRAAGDGPDEIRRLRRHMRQSHPPRRRLRPPRAAAATGRASVRDCKQSVQGAQWACGLCKNDTGRTAHRTSLHR